MNSLRALTAVALLFSCCTSACADILELHNGSKLYGKWLNPTKDANRPALFEFETEEGAQIAIASRQVKNVIVESENEKKYMSIISKAGDDVAVHMNAKKWCMEHNLTALADAHYGRILDLEPDNKEARARLNYVLTKPDGWVREDRLYGSNGMIKREGKWRFPEDIALEEMRQKVKEEIAKSGKEFERHWNEGSRSDQSQAYLLSVKSPSVVPKIRELLKGKAPPQTHSLLFDILSRIQSPESVSVLGEQAITNPEARLRQQSLDALKQFGASIAISNFESRLKNINKQSDTPEIVNRLAYALRELDARQSIPTLIDRLITEHITTTNGGGNNQAGFSTDGGTSFGQGNRSAKISQQSQNRDVLSALRYLTNADFGFDQAKWRYWYAENSAKTRLSLRRDP